MDCSIALSSDYIEFAVYGKSKRSVNPLLSLSHSLSNHVLPFPNPHTPVCSPFSLFDSPPRSPPPFIPSINFFISTSIRTLSVSSLSVSLLTLTDRDECITASLSLKLAEEIKYETENSSQGSSSELPEFLNEFKSEGVWSVRRSQSLL